MWLAATAYVRAETEAAAIEKLKICDDCSFVHFPTGEYDGITLSEETFGSSTLPEVSYASAITIWYTDPGESFGIGNAEIVHDDADAA